MASALASTLVTRGLREWQGKSRPRTPSHVRRERSMDKWRTVKDSTIIRIAASTGALVAVAALVGAGLKWY
jgi:hypothetical protein